MLDIDALRQALGADKVALMGISYGTHVALQYARAFPEHVDRLILDSIVGPDGPDAFLLDTYRNLPRVLAEQCAHGACRNATKDPVADVAALVRRINASGPLRGDYYDAHGKLRATRYATPDELSFLLIAGDLNPFLQAALPAAISAARRGDTAPLMRLRRIGQGGATRADGPLGRPQRRHRLHRRDAALPAVGAGRRSRGGGPGGARGDPAHRLRPVRRADRAAHELRRRLPGLAGRRDPPAVHRAAARRAGAAARRAPGHAHAAGERARHGARAAARDDRRPEGLGPRRARQRHHGLHRRRRWRASSTTSPSVTRAWARTTACGPTPLPPRSLRDFRSAPGVGGTRGRAVFAVLDTLTDARLSALQALFAGLQVNGGGLRGGSFSGQASFDGACACTAMRSSRACASPARSPPPRA